MRTRTNDRRHCAESLRPFDEEALQLPIVQFDDPRVVALRLAEAADLHVAKAAALEGTHPATDAIASEWYRREVLPVHLGRLLTGEGR